MLEAIFEYAKTNFGGFISDTIILGAVSFILKLYFTNSFQKKLETHKGVVNGEIEALRHQRQLGFKEFDLYTTKRHEIYPELFKRVETAFGQTMEYFNRNFYIDFKQFSLDDLNRYMTENKFSTEERDRITQLFLTDVDSASFEIVNNMRKISYYKAKTALNDANNFYILNELYLTEQATSSTKNFLIDMLDYWHLTDPSYPYTAETTKQARDMRENVLPLKRSQFKTTLKNDLTALNP